MKINIWKYLSVCFIALILSSCFLFGGGEDDTGSTEPENKGTVTEYGRDRTGKAVENDIFNKNLWGEWVRMDNGDIWYFTSNYLSIRNSANNGSSFTFDRQSDNVIKVTEKLTAGDKIFYLYASRIPNGNFRGSIFNPAGNVSGLSLKFTDTTNPSITRTVTTTTDGSFKVSDIVIGNEYDLTVGNRTIPVTANSSGEDIGIITLGDGINFKIKITPDNSNTDMLALYPDTNYSFTISIKNVGNVVTTAPRYIISLPEGLTRISGSDIRGNISTLNPGATGTLSFTLSCAKSSLNDEFENKRIGIKMLDAFDDSKSWNDSVELKFNRDKETFNFRAYNRTPGVVIVPGAKAYFFNTTSGSSSNYSTSLTLPKYTGRAYLIVFSGASVISGTQEGLYSFAVGKEALTPNNENFNSVSGGSISGYDKYNVEGNPMIITPYNKQHVSLLWDNGIVYYSITFPSGVVIGD